MLRWLFILLIAAGIAGGVAHSQGWLDEYIEHGVSLIPRDPTHTAQQTRAVELGALLYPAQTLAPLKPQEVLQYEEIIIEPCHAKARETQMVSNAKEGRVLFIGQDAETTPATFKATRPKKVVSTFIGSQTLSKEYYPLEEGDVVDYLQLVVLMDPALAMHEVLKSKVKITAAKAEFDATKAILEEARLRLGKLEDLNRSGKNVVTYQEMGDARIAVSKYVSDLVSKEEQIKSSQYENYQALLLLDQHYMKSQLLGKSFVKKIHKAMGEGIKPQEPIVELWSMNSLKIEGSVESQYYQTLQSHKTARCFIEPSVEMKPSSEMTISHGAEVTSVAACSDGKKFVSGSEDKTVCVWRADLANPIFTLVHSAPVRTVECNPKGTELLVGCLDGSLTVWDLKDDTKEPKKLAEIKDKHRGPITALAFSPNGEYFASGGEDYNILIWKTKDTQVLFPFDAEHGVDEAHSGSVTSLHFTPECKSVSAARDGTLRVWQLHANGAKRLLEPIANRGVGIDQLGVSADGRFMLFNQGRALRLLNTANGATVCAPIIWRAPTRSPRSLCFLPTAR